MSEIISIPILELMEKTEQWLLNQGYKKNTLGVYKATWNKFRAYSSSPFYDRETAEKFLLRYFGVDANAIDQKLDMQNESFVTRELVEAWDSAKPYLSNRTKIQRHNTIRKFAAFAFANDGISASLRKRRSATATPMFPARRKSATRSAPMKSIKSLQPLMWTTISALTRRQRGNFRALIIGVLTSVCTQRKIRWRICGQSTIGIPAPLPIGCVPCP